MGYHDTFNDDGAAVCLLCGVEEPSKKGNFITIFLDRYNIIVRELQEIQDPYRDYQLFKENK